MLNRIRRAVSLTRARYAPKGRHRRPLTPSHPPVTPAHSAPTDASATVQGRATNAANHRYPLDGEENALVRPYVLAWEQRVRPRAVVVASRMPAEAWSTLAGVH